MKLKSFKSYSDFYSKDPKNFEKRIVLASPVAHKLSIFEAVLNSTDILKISKDIPVIAWNNFSFTQNRVHENFCSVVYNQSNLPTSTELRKEFREEPFIPTIIQDRSMVKKMKFPIIGVKDDTEEEFKTYGKFKKSTIPFNHFKEKLVPVSRFEILVSGDTPIHVQKKINSTPFDIDMNRWKHLGEATNICTKINSSYSPEFYSITLVEANGALYLESVNRDSEFTPSQEVKLYESAYANYYKSTLPGWFRKKMFEDHVKPYYIKKYYDSLLFKPSGVIDYSKYIN
jgi:hypothetical protein